MSGLKLQVLSNPSPAPSFIIGNPQAVSKPKKKAIAKKGRKRENGSMSKRRKPVRKGRKPVRRRRRKNPFEQIFSKGGKKTKVGPFLSAKEIKKDRTAMKYLLKEIKNLKKKASTPLHARLLSEKKSRFLAIATQARKARAHLKHVQATVKKLKAEGWRSDSTRRISAGAAIRKSRHHAKGKASSGFAAFEAGIAAKKSGKKASKKSSKKKSSKKKASKGHKSSKAKAKALKGGKGRSGKKAAFGGWKIVGREGQFMIMRGPGGKTKRFKIKKRGKAKVKKNPSRRRKGGRVVVRRKKSSRRKKTSSRRKSHVKKNPRRRRGHSKRHGKHRYRRNPFGGAIMGIKQLAKSTFNPAGGIGASNMAIAALAVTPFSLAITKLLDKASGGRVSAMGSQAGPVGQVVSVIPAFIAAVGFEALGEKMKSDRVKKVGQAAALLAIADLVQGLSGGVMQGVLASAGLAGVSYTPMGRRRTGLGGVSFTRNHMGAVPRGLSAVPRGLGSYMPSPGGTLSTDADFGALPHGMHGLTHRDNSDFGNSRQAADFGGVDFTMGAYPSMRGAHTGDVQYAPSDDQPGSDDDQTNESNDHTV